jgi:hypothetical protein
MKTLDVSLTSIGMPLCNDNLSFISSLASTTLGCSLRDRERTTAIPIHDLFAKLLATEHSMGAPRTEASTHYPIAPTATYERGVAAYGEAYARGVVAYGGGNGGFC